MGTSVTTKHYLQEELEQRIQSGSDIFDFLCKASADGIWYWDLESPEHEWMSPEFWELFGVDPATKSHRANEWQDLIHPDDRDLAMATFEAHCADPNYPYDQIVRYRHADGSTVWVRCRGLAIRDAEGRPVRMLGVHSDVTALKRAEEQLRLANEDLDHFTHIAAHDLREPARRQQMIVSLILESYADEVPPELAVDLERLRQQAVHMANMVNDFRSLTGLSDSELIRHRIDMAELISKVADEVFFRDLKLRIAPLPYVYCYPNLVQILLQNLLTNVCHHGTDPVEVTHECRSCGRDWFVISNSWDEDPVTVTDALLRPFTGRSSPERTGMGLSICKRVVDRHRGDIVLEPTERSFTVAFTLSAEPERHL